MTSRRMKLSLQRVEWPWEQPKNVMIQRDSKAMQDKRNVRHSARSNPIRYKILLNQNVTIQCAIQRDSWTNMNCPRKTPEKYI